MYITNEKKWGENGEKKWKTTLTEQTSLLFFSPYLLCFVAIFDVLQ